MHAPIHTIIKSAMIQHMIRDGTGSLHKGSGARYNAVAVITLDTTAELSPVMIQVLLTQIHDLHLVYVNSLEMVHIKATVVIHCYGKSRIYLVSTDLSINLAPKSAQNKEK